MTRPANKLSWPPSAQRTCTIGDELLGKGGFYEVVEAKVQTGDATPIKAVAKGIRPENYNPLPENSRATIRDSLIVEGFTLARLVRAGVPGVPLEWGMLIEADDDSEDGHQHPDLGIRLVQSRIDGTDLTKCFDPDSPLSPAQVLHVAHSVGQTLSGAHDARITHRDLKPGNIMVDHAGTIWVVDWGLSNNRASRPRYSLLDLVRKLHDGRLKFLDVFELLTDALSTNEEPRLKTGRDSWGTPQFSAPELPGPGPTDPRSDQYSLGCIMIALLNGDHLGPKSAKTIDGVCDAARTRHASMHLEAHRSEPLAPVRAPISTELQEAISRMTQFDPEDRFPNMDAALTALRRTPEFSAESAPIQVLL